MATSKKKAPPPPPVEEVDRTGWKYWMNGESVSEETYLASVADHAAWAAEQARLAAMPEEPIKKRKKK